MHSTEVFNELCQNNFAHNYSESILTEVCNAVYLRSCIDLMHILPPVTAEGYDSFHHPRYADCVYVSNYCLGIHNISSH